MPPRAPRGGRRGRGRGRGGTHPDPAPAPAPTAAVQAVRRSARERVPARHRNDLVETLAERPSRRRTSRSADPPRHPTSPSPPPRAPTTQPVPAPSNVAPSQTLVDDAGLVPDRPGFSPRSQTRFSVSPVPGHAVSVRLALSAFNYRLNFLFPARARLSCRGPVPRRAPFFLSCSVLSSRARLCRHRSCAPSKPHARHPLPGAPSHRGCCST